MSKFCHAIVILSLVACSHSPPKPADVEADLALQAEFDRGLKALDDENYSSAIKIFETLLLQKPATELDLVTQFNLAAAYEGTGDCQRAADRYRHVVQSSANKFQRVEAESLFRLSLAYECLGQDAKTVTALLDAKKRGKTFGFETLNAEIPARLAAAYSRLGNRAKAIEYFNQASRGLKSIVAQGNGHVPRDLLGRTLYVMGKLNAAQRSGDVDPTSFLASLSMQQPELLQAVEMKIPNWSRRAENDLRQAYDNIWKFNIDDSEKKRAFYTQTLQVINELKKIRMPKSDPDIDSIFAQVDLTEARVQKELVKVGDTNKLTPEAEKLESPRRKGRLIDPPKAKNQSTQ